jgi:hypothetical protein
LGSHVGLFKFNLIKVILKKVIETKKGWININTLQSKYVSHLTRELLNLSQPYYDAIVIGVRHEVVKYSLTFPWTDCSVIGEPNNETKGRSKSNNWGSGWPAIWEIGDKLKISGGAGNSHQRQIDYKKINYLTKGAYKLENNIWYKQLNS